MSNQRQNNYALPGWFKNAVWLVSTVVVSLIAVGRYIDNHKEKDNAKITEAQTKVAVLEEQVKNLKDMYLKDIKEIQENVREINGKLDNIK